MSRRNRDSIENLSGLRELDRLVIQVMRALQPGPPQDAGNVRDDNVIYRERWGETAYEGEGVEADYEVDPARSKRRPTRHDSPLAEGDWEDGADVPVTEDWSEPMPEELEEAPSGTDEPMDPKASEDSVLSEAEVAFIDRTSRWLERRPHRDIILDQIWRRLLPEDVAESTTDDAPDDSQSNCDDGVAEDTNETD